MSSFIFFLILLFVYIISCNILLLGGAKTIIGIISGMLIITIFYFSPSLSQYFKDIPFRYYLISIGVGIFVFGSLWTNKNPIIGKIGSIGVMTLFGSISFGFAVFQVLFFLELIVLKYRFIYKGYPKSYKYEFMVYVFIRCLFKLFKIRSLKIGNVCQLAKYLLRAPGFCLIL